MSRQLVIIGGGDSIRAEAEQGLWSKLEGRYTIGLNYNFYHFNSTCLMGVDDEFYNNKEVFEKLEKLPLIVFGFDKEVKKYHPNTIVLRTHYKYSRDLSSGAYCSRLAGMFALTLGIYLLDVGTIFLLGYDYNWNEKKIMNNKFVTHYYQGEIKHRGIGHWSYYNSIERTKNDFAPYKDETKVKVFNVIGEPESRIPIFEKIDYPTFYSKLDNVVYDQTKLREEIKKKLQCFKMEV